MLSSSEFVSTLFLVVSLLKDTHYHSMPGCSLSVSFLSPKLCFLLSHTSIFSVNTLLYSSFTFSWLTLSPILTLSTSFQNIIYLFYLLKFFGPNFFLLSVPVFVQQSELVKLSLFRRVYLAVCMKKKLDKLYLAVYD